MKSWDLAVSLHISSVSVTSTQKHSTETESTHCITVLKGTQIPTRSISLFIVDIRYRLRNILNSRLDSSDLLTTFEFKSIQEQIIQTY
ncbi:hypothetical protein BDV3_005389 [Batrachochytrium dendrobatidis]